MAADKPSWRKHFLVSRGDATSALDLEAQPLLSKAKARDPSHSPSRFRFPGAQSIDIVKKGAAKADEPFSYDVWSNTPPEAATSQPDVEQMAQAMMSRLNLAPSAGLPASYNSHVYRVIRSNQESMQKIEALKRKVEESSLLNEHLRMQLDRFHPERKRAHSNASKASWEYLRERVEHPNKNLSPADSSIFEKHVASSPEFETISVGTDHAPQRAGRKASNTVMTRSIYTMPAEQTESTPALIEAKTDGTVSSSTNTMNKSGDILSTMYHLAGLMVGKRNISFHYAFYRIFRAFYGDIDHTQNQPTSASQQLEPLTEMAVEDMPPLSELLEEASRLESGDMTPRMASGESTESRLAFKELRN